MGRIWQGMSGRAGRVALGCGQPKAVMRIATILPRSSVEPVVVIEGGDGTWSELAGIMNRPVLRMEEALPWLMLHEASVASRTAAWRGPRYRKSEFSFLPPVLRPPAVREYDSYPAHAASLASRSGQVLPEGWAGVPSFAFCNTNSLLGSGAVVRPPRGGDLDIGLQLGVVIGKSGTDIAAGRAWDHVAGFTVVNALCLRDEERRERARRRGPSKSRDFATAIGPWLVMKSGLPGLGSGGDLGLTGFVRVNGKALPKTSFAGALWSIPQLIEHASRGVELFCGEIVTTGTCPGGSFASAGEGWPPGRWLSPSDVVEVEVEGLGWLRTSVS